VIEVLSEISRSVFHNLEHKPMPAVLLSKEGTRIPAPESFIDAAEVLKGAKLASGDSDEPYPIPFSAAVLQLGVAAFGGNDSPQLKRRRVPQTDEEALSLLRLGDFLSCSRQIKVGSDGISDAYWKGLLANGDVDKVIGLLEWGARFPLYTFRGLKEHYGTVPLSAWNYRGIHRLEEALRKLRGLKTEKPPFFALFFCGQRLLAAANRGIWLRLPGRIPGFR
jgi:hypothetical protein